MDRRDSAFPSSNREGLIATSVERMAPRTLPGSKSDRFQGGETRKTPRSPS